MDMELGWTVLDAPVASASEGETESTLSGEEYSKRLDETRAPVAEVSVRATDPTCSGWGLACWVGVRVLFWT